MKTVVITGAAAGMGLSDTKKFLAEGWNVVMADYNEKGQEAADQLQAEYPDQKVLFVQVNVADAASVQALADKVSAEFETVDCIVNNAGVLVKGRLDEVDEAGWDRVMDIDVKSIYLMTKSFMPKLMKQKSASIVNIASVSGLLGDYEMAAYNAAKGAVVNLVRSMALDYGKYGIRVNNVCPGPTNTAMLTNNPPELVKHYYEGSPLGHVVEPSEISAMVYFLASDEAASITGQNMPVTAGYGIYTGQPVQ
ncbi:SDR family NAD(P)-dependent oxidoreductase [Lactobacillus delbrueckii]|uniref:SDR family NAD(P)-dependent oxidoreductase n=1 Tax=Lactobacillus delbrueckii TaxID=1584 RepID=UPI00399243E8